MEAEVGWLIGILFFSFVVVVGVLALFLVEMAYASKRGTETIQQQAIREHLENEQKEKIRLLKND